GLQMGHSVQAQAVLMWTDLAIAMEAQRSLSSLVQPGMRAVDVRAGSEKNTPVRPGDRIDVIATMSQGSGGDSRSSVVLLQNILVLAVGGDTGLDPLDKGGAGSRGDVLLSLSLNVPEAQLLALAAEKGKISVALRNPDDVRVTEGMSDMPSSALF